MCWPEVSVLMTPGYIAVNHLTYFFYLVISSQNSLHILYILLGTNSVIFLFIRFIFLMQKYSLSLVDIYQADCSYVSERDCSATIFCILN